MENLFNFIFQAQQDIRKQAPYKSSAYRPHATAARYWCARGNAKGGCIYQHRPWEKALAPTHIALMLR
jgi:hypothetical protein